MLLKFGILSVVLFTSEISESIVNSLECDNLASVQVCLENKSIEVLISTNDLTCQASEISRQKVRDDYTHVPGIGYYKFHTQAQKWNDARKVCMEEGGHLAIINSSAEEKVLLKMFRAEAGKIREGANKEQAFLGIHDLYQEGEWLTIFGESLYSTGYAKWSTSYWGPQPDNKDNNQNCGALVLKGGGLDDVHCHEKFAFFCELPLSCA